MLLYKVYDYLLIIDNNVTTFMNSLQKNSLKMEKHRCNPIELRKIMRLGNVLLVHPPHMVFLAIRLSMLRIFLELAPDVEYLICKI